MRFKLTKSPCCFWDLTIQFHLSFISHTVTIHQNTPMSMKEFGGVIKHFPNERLWQHTSSSWTEYYILNGQFVLLLLGHSVMLWTKTWMQHCWWADLDCYAVIYLLNFFSHFKQDLTLWHIQFVNNQSRYAVLFCNYNHQVKHDFWQDSTDTLPHWPKNYNTYQINNCAVFLQMLAVDEVERALKQLFHIGKVLH